MRISYRAFIRYLTQPTHTVIRPAPFPKLKIHVQKRKIHAAIIPSTIAIGGGVLLGYLSKNAPKS